MSCENNEIIELKNLNIKHSFKLVRFHKKQKIKIGKNTDEKFLKLYNTGVLFEELYKTLGKVCSASLYRLKGLLEYKYD